MSASLLLTMLPLSSYSRYGRAVKKYVYHQVTLYTNTYTYIPCYNKLCTSTYTMLPLPTRGVSVVRIPSQHNLADLVCAFSKFHLAFHLSSSIVLSGRFCYRRSRSSTAFQCRSGFADSEILDWQEAIFHSSPCTKCVLPPARHWGQKHPASSADGSRPWRCRYTSINTHQRCIHYYIRVYTWSREPQER
jgi:hypothetical protein